jgi:hypothetical protein
LCLWGCDHSSSCASNGLNALPLAMVNTHAHLLMAQTLKTVTQGTIREN